MAEIATTDGIERGFTVGRWQAYPRDGELRGSDGSVVRLRPKVADLLLELARHAGDVCPRESLVAALWGDRAVSDEPLAKSVAELRTCLGDTASRQEYIQTVPKRGYRLVMPVQPLAPAERPAAETGAADGAAGDPLEAAGFHGIQPLAEHGATELLLARDRQLQRQVVVRRLKPEFLGDEQARLRFQREAEAAARVHHPHVAVIYQTGTLGDGTPFLAEQYVEGTRLRQLIDLEAPLDLPRLRAIGRSLASALAALHGQQVLHRKFTPETVLIDTTGHCYLTDFGLARLLDSELRLTAPGELPGELDYLSPEQLRGQAASPASDVYALGLVLYELACGRYPYDRAGIAGSWHVEAEPTPPATASEEVDRLLLSCLHKDPVRRPGASQLARLFDALAETSTAPSEVPQRGTLPWLAAAGLLLAAALVMVFWG